MELLTKQQIEQSRAQLPQTQKDESSAFEITLPGVNDAVKNSPLGKAYDAASSWLGEHEKHLSEKYLAPFRQGLDNIASDLS
jgi:hypothetical protein